jgi:microcystin degradation protein MlrC
MSGLFLAGLDTETNSFSPIPTDEAAFAATLLAYGDATRRPLNSCSSQLMLWRQRAEALGMTVHEGPCAVAEPGGLIVRSFYEAFRERLLADLSHARPDMVLLALHGAAIAEGYDDIEGDILARVREIAGPDGIVCATLDPHCHLTDLMMEQATALIAYKEYPHTDIAATADALFTLALKVRAGTARPVMAKWDCRMIAAYPTQSGAMRAFVDAMSAAERDDPALLSLSLAHGFAHGDVADVGTRMLAIADGDPHHAVRTAEGFGRCIVALRDRIVPAFAPFDAAVERIASAPPGPRPLVAADTGDNPGGGATGDATFLLRACIERGVTDVAFAIFHDPGVVAACRAAGIGAVLDLALGGRWPDVSGPAVRLRGAEVLAIGLDMAQDFGGAMLPMGNAVAIEAHGISIVISDFRTQVFDPVCLTGLGLDPAAFRAIIVKSLNHFTALFTPIAGHILYAATPGVTSPDYAAIPYTKRALDFWPRCDDPWNDGPISPLDSRGAGR